MMIIEILLFEVEETMHDDTDNKISDNNEDEKDEKEDNIIAKSNVTKSMSVLCVAHFFPKNYEYI